MHGSQGERIRKNLDYPMAAAGDKFMKKRPLIITAASVLILIAVLAVWRSFEREPEYNGRPLSYWLDKVLVGDFADSNHVTIEFHGGFDHYGYRVRQSDTNATLWTISWYTEKDERLL